MNVKIELDDETMIIHGGMRCERSISSFKT